MKYELLPNKYFSKKLRKLVKKNPELIQTINKVQKIMVEDPFDKKLGTHKVDARMAKNCYSSAVTGDIRIIWDFNEDQIYVLDLFDVGGHDGINRVY